MVFEDDLLKLSDISTLGAKDDDGSFSAREVVFGFDLEDWLPDWLPDWLLELPMIPCCAASSSSSSEDKSPEENLRSSL